MQNNNDYWCATLTLNNLSKTNKESTQYSLSTTETTAIGRSPECQIVLDPSQYITVSRRHVEIQLNKSVGVWEIGDTGTTNGTLINDQQIDSVYQLKSGDRITLGLKGPEFTFECHALNATVLVAKPEAEEVKEKSKSEPQTEDKKSPTEDIVEPEAPIAINSAEVSTANLPETEEKPTIEVKEAVSSNKDEQMPELLVSEEIAQEASVSVTPKNTPSKLEEEKLDSLTSTINDSQEPTSIAESTINSVTPVPEKVDTEKNQDFSNISSPSKNLWNLIDLKELGQFLGHGKEVKALAFSPDGKTLASAGADNKIRLWLLIDATELLAISTPIWQIGCVCISTDGQIFASCSEDNKIRLWQL